MQTYSADDPARQRPIEIAEEIADTHKIRRNQAPEISGKSDIRDTHKLENEISTKSVAGEQPVM